VQQTFLERSERALHDACGGELTEELTPMSALERLFPTR